MTGGWLSDEFSDAAATTMKMKFLLFQLFVSFISTGSASAQGSSATNNQFHNWNHIVYEPDGPDCPDFMIGFGEKTQGFRVDVIDVNPSLLRKGKLVSLKLHNPDGRVLKAPETNFTWVMFGNANNTNWRVMTYFPWATNSLAECWIQVSFASERYWLEIPYGFYRNPKDQLPAAVQGGEPKLTPAMTKLTVHDHVMRWKNVRYDLGEIQNHWRLSLIQSNPLHPVSEVVLYREDNKLWDLHTPRTALRLLEADGSATDARCISVSLHDDPKTDTFDSYRRSDIYHIFSDGDDDQRSWGQIEITVEDKSYRVVVPSSLFISLHGHARTD